MTFCKLLQTFIVTLGGIGKGYFKKDAEPIESPDKKEDRPTAKIVGQKVKKLLSVTFHMR